MSTPVHHEYLTLNEDGSVTPGGLPALAAAAHGAAPTPRAFSRKKHGFTRQQVVNQFQEAFELIGGVRRLVLWADQNPTEFYKLYGKLLPSTTDTTFAGEVKHVIEHVLPRTALDNHTEGAGLNHED